MIARSSQLSLPMVPTPGSDIGDCFDQALGIAQQLGCTVTFEFNEVHCGVRRSDDDRPERRQWFLDAYHRMLKPGEQYKFCYANPPPS